MLALVSILKMVVDRVGGIALFGRLKLFREIKRVLTRQGVKLSPRFRLKTLALFVARASKIA